MKRIFALFLAALLMLGTACGGVPQQDYDQLSGAHDALQAQVAVLTEELDAQGEALTDALAALELANSALAKAEENLLAAETEAQARQTEIDTLNTQLAEAQAKASQAQTQAAMAPAAGTAGTAGTAPAEAPAAPAAEPTGGGTVWIPNSGSKYHSTANCSNMKNPSQVSLADAIAWGYGQCKKCW